MKKRSSIRSPLIGIVVALLDEPETGHVGSPRRFDDEEGVQHGAHHDVGPLLPEVGGHLLDRAFHMFGAPPAVQDVLDSVELQLVPTSPRSRRS